MKTNLISTTERLAALLAAVLATGADTETYRPTYGQSRRMSTSSAVESWRIPAYRRRRQRVSQP